MFCMYCGKELNDDLLFCTSCGKPTVNNPASSALNSTLAVEQTVTDQATLAMDAIHPTADPYEPTQAFLPTAQDASVKHYATPEARTFNDRPPASPQFTPVDPRKAAQQSFQPTFSHAEQKRKAWPFVLAIAIVILLLIVIAGIMVFLNKDTLFPPKATPSSATEVIESNQEKPSEQETPQVDEKKNTDAYLLTQNDIKTMLGAQETPVSEYVLPDSHLTYYSEKDLQSLSNWSLFIARNEIFARHGRMFKNEVLQTYFNNTSWYKAQYTPEEFDALSSPLNDYELKNVDALHAVEQSRNSPYLSNAEDAIAAYQDTVPYWGVWVYASTSKADAEKFITTQSIDPATYEIVSTVHWTGFANDSTYAVTAGKYPSKTAAEKAVENLPQSLKSCAYIKYTGFYQ